MFSQNILVKENQCSGVETYSELLSKTVLQFTQRTKATATAPGCQPELNGAILLLKTIHFGCKMDRQAGTDLKTSSLLGSFHRKCHEVLCRPLGRKIFQWSRPVANSVCQSSNLLGGVPTGTSVAWQLWR